MTSYKYLWREYDYYDAFELLTESNHCSEIFDEFIDDIVENIDQYIDNEKDTGWYYNMRDYNVNKNKEGVKLKLIIKQLPRLKEFGYINPDRFPEITIHLSNMLLMDIPKFKSVLLHELTHVIKVYIKNRNGMTTNRESLLDEIYLYNSEFNIRFKNKKIGEQVYNFLYDIFYIISDNEQLATINETCKYLKSINIDTIHEYLKTCIKKSLENDELILETGGTMLTKNAQIYNILLYLKEHHFLNYMINVENKFYNYNNGLLLLIAYYLNKHGYIKKPKLQYINFDIVYIAIHSKSTYKLSKNIETDINHMYNCICANFEKYKKKLYDAVFVIMDKNNMFLHKDEVYNLIPKNKMKFVENSNIIY